MNCEDVRRWKGALLDGELDAKNTAEIHGHFARCPPCLAAFRADQALQASLRRVGVAYEMPESLRQRIVQSLPGASVGTSPRRLTSREIAARWIARTGWVVAFAASAFLAVVVTERRTDVHDEIVALHVRSLLADHLCDVSSSDRHTVKPWFAGKLDFAPPVPDLSMDGYPLVGGRLEYLQGRVIAAVVYRKRTHTINVLVSPRSQGGAIDEEQLVVATHRGYSVGMWHASGLTFAAVADMDPQGLAAFQRAYESQLQQ